MLMHLSQVPSFYCEVRRAGERPVNKTALAGAKTLADFCPGYPTHWVSDYISAQITIISRGKEAAYQARNDTLTPEQKQALAQADLGSQIKIEVKHRYQNPVTRAMSEQKMMFENTVVPEKEAAFPGGKEALANWLKTNKIEAILSHTLPETDPLQVAFFVTETGEIAGLNVVGVANQKLGYQLMDLLRTMPRWQPAENSKREKVKQAFLLVVGQGGC